MHAFCPCLDLSTSAPLKLLTCGGVQQDANVYENQASLVCLISEPLFQDISSIALLERYACAHGWQDGGGLHISGTATLTNTNVYENQADRVCSPLNIP